MNQLTHPNQIHMIKGKNGKLIKRMMMLLEKDHENDWLKTSYTQGQGSLCF